MDKTFFNFKLELEPNIIDMLYDLLRMSTIQIITQICFYLNNSSLSLFNETFVKTFFFINISIISYYLLVRRIFSFISDDYLNTYFKESDLSYASTPPIGYSSNSNKTSLSSGLETLNNSNKTNKTNNSPGRGLSKNTIGTKPKQSNNTSSNNTAIASATTTTNTTTTQPTAASISNISTPSIGSTPISNTQ
jgi:hypothetical protein